MPSAQHLAGWVRKAVRDAECALQAPGQAASLLHALTVEVRATESVVEVHLRFAVSYGVSIPTVTKMIHRFVAGRLAAEAGLDDVRLFFDVDDLEFPVD